MKKLTSLILSSSLLLSAVPAFAFDIDGEILANSSRSRLRRALLQQIGAEQKAAEEAVEEETVEEEVPAEPEAEEVAPVEEEAPPAEAEEPEVKKEKKVGPLLKKKSALQRLEDRTCGRVYRRFADQPTMIARVNERLLDRFGFECREMDLSR